MKGTRACQETSGRADAYGRRAEGTRAIWLKLDCLNLISSRGKPLPPPERRMKPVPGKLHGMQKVRIRIPLAPPFFVCLFDEKVPKLLALDHGLTCQVHAASPASCCGLGSRR